YALIATSIRLTASIFKSPSCSPNRNQKGLGHLRDLAGFTPRMMKQPSEGTHAEEVGPDWTRITTRAYWSTLTVLHVVGTRQNGLDFRKDLPGPNSTRTLAQLVGPDWTRITNHPPCAKLLQGTSFGAPPFDRRPRAGPSTASMDQQSSAAD